MPDYDIFDEDVLVTKKPIKKKKPVFKLTWEWQFRPIGEKTWYRDGNNYSSLRKALVYSNIAAECQECSGHRLVQKLVRGITVMRRDILLYTLSSKPKES